MLTAEFLSLLQATTRDGMRVNFASAEIEDVAGPIEGRRYYRVAPKDLVVTDVTDDLLKTLPNPRARTGTVALASLESFVDFVWRMKEHSSVLFADTKTSTIQCVFDYHEELNAPRLVEMAEVTPATTVPLPRWGRFKASYNFPFHRSWTTWRGGNQKPMSQADLAGWIEDNIIDVLDLMSVEGDIQSAKTKELIATLGLRATNRSKLLAAARGLSVRVTEKVGQVINTNTGEISVQYEQSHDSGTGETHAAERIDVPTAFILVLPVFEGGEAFELLVRLRYRRDGMQIKWWYDIYNVDRALDLAFKTSCEQIMVKTELPLYFVDSSASRTHG